MYLSFEKNPGVLNWIEVRGVRWVGLESDVISFQEGEHTLSFAVRMITSEGPRGQEGANSEGDLGRQGQ